MSDIIAFHGGPDKIDTFSSDYGGETTCDNEHGAFYFSNLVEVAEDYSVQSIVRRYQDCPESLVDDDRISQERFDEIEEGSEDWYDFVEEYAQENRQVVKAILTLSNPLMVDADYQNLREFEKEFNIQNAIGFIMGKAVDEIPEVFYDSFNEETGEGEEFDSLIIKNVIDDIGDKSCVYQTIYIAISDRQIRQIN